MNNQVQSGICKIGIEMEVNNYYGRKQFDFEPLSTDTFNIHVLVNTYHRNINRIRNLFIVRNSRKITLLRNDSPPYSNHSYSS